VTRPPRRSPPQDAARGFWIRAWGQREPAFQGTGRSNDPAQRQGLFEGGLDAPCPHAKTKSPRIEHPIRTLTYRTLVTRRSNRVLYLSCEYSITPYRLPPRDASAGRSRPLPGCCPRQRVCPIPGTDDSWRSRSIQLHNGRRQPGTTNRPRACRWADSPAHRGGILPKRKGNARCQPTVLGEQDKELNGS
jgi:hypothetical protein